MIDLESRRRPAGEQPVYLGRTKEAGLGLRMLQQLDGEDGGIIEDSAGRRGEAATFDQDADWVDYWGSMAGHRVGLALLPHPENPRLPWFTRDYGIVVWNHVRHGAVTLAPGDELRLERAITRFSNKAYLQEMAAALQPELAFPIDRPEK